MENVNVGNNTSQEFDQELGQLQTPNTEWHAENNTGIREKLILSTSKEWEERVNQYLADEGYKCLLTHHN